jgi:hypothetical protein
MPTTTVTLSAKQPPALNTPHAWTVRGVRIDGVVIGCTEIGPEQWDLTIALSADDHRRMVDALNS